MVWDLGNAQQFKAAMAVRPDIATSRSSFEQAAADQALFIGKMKSIPEFTNGEDMKRVVNILGGAEPLIVLGTVIGRILLQTIGGQRSERNPGVLNAEDVYFGMYKTGDSYNEYYQAAGGFPGGNPKLVHVQPVLRQITREVLHLFPRSYEGKANPYYTGNRPEVLQGIVAAVEELQHGCWRFCGTLDTVSYLQQKLGEHGPKQPGEGAFRGTPRESAVDPIQIYNGMLGRRQVPFAPFAYGPQNGF